MSTEEIIHTLHQHKKIAELLSVKKWLHFKWYFFIAENYLKKNHSKDFEKRFSWFYAFRGMTQPEKDLFFRILFSKKETDLGTILRGLSRYKNTVYFSFATKLLHTRNNQRPIYDSFVAMVLGLPKLKGDTTDQKVENRRRVYEKLLKSFQELFDNLQTRNHVKQIRRELLTKAKQEDFNWRDELVSDEKLLDSSLWVLHKIQKD